MSRPRWYMVRLAYERDDGHVRFWWLSRGDSRRDAGLEAHRRFVGTRDGSSGMNRLEEISVFDLEWLDNVVDAALLREKGSPEEGLAVK